MGVERGNFVVPNFIPKIAAWRYGTSTNLRLRDAFENIAHEQMNPNSSEMFGNDFAINVGVIDPHSTIGQTQGSVQRRHR